MTCISCGLQLVGESALCPHHALTSDNWAAGNRATCNLLHRGIVSARLPVGDRDDEDGYGSVSDVA